jgi:hypothetical protein
MLSPNFEIFSFNEIVDAPWENLKDKKFKRIDTDAFLGFVYAKYDNKFKLSSMLNDGIIEFLDKTNNNIIRIFGIDFNKDHKLFQVII